jgi:hypothetical protein
MWVLICDPFHYMCVLILLHVFPHTAICVTHTHKTHTGRYVTERDICAIVGDNIGTGNLRTYTHTHTQTHANIYDGWR